MSVFNQARGLLEKWRAKPVPKSTAAIRQDAYDRDVFDDILTKAPKVKQLVKDIGKEWDYAEDLMADIFADMWQGDPLLRSKQEVVESRRPNQEVLQHFRNTPEREQLRPHTMHDEYGTAMAVSSVGGTLKETLKDKQAEKEAAKQAQEQAQRAREQAQQAVQALEEGCGQPGPGQGATPEEVAAHEAAMQALLDAAQQADQALTEAEQRAQQATQALTDPLRQAVGQALKEEVKRAEEEAQLCQSFGAEDGALQRMSFEERTALMNRLHASRLAQFADEIGRLRIAFSGQRMRRVTQAREEAYSVELSGDLARVLPSELLKLVTHPMLKTKFALDLANRRMLSRKYRGKEKLGKGSIIAVVDCSGSMGASMGGKMTREAWAKAICLSLLDNASRQGRDMEVILFSSSSQQVRFSFPNGRSNIETVIDMTEHFFGGGTSYEQPLRQAMNLLVEKYNKDGKPKADVVFITDDAGQVSPAFTRAWLDAKERLQFRVFGIALGAHNSTSGVLSTVSDNVRLIADMVDPDQMSDIFASV
ncbi:MAG: VWA domain-containing protein [Oryzihumus sp.]